MRGSNLGLRDGDFRFLRWLVIAAIGVLAAGAAGALSVTVDCDGGPADYATLQDAINALTPADYNAITVSGTCVESVVIGGFANLTIDAPAGAAVQAAGGFSAIEIDDSPAVLLSGLAVDAAGADFGLALFRSTVRVLGSTFVGAADTAVAAFSDSDLVLGGIGPGDGVTVSDNEFGVFASQSTFRLNGQVTIEDNAQDALILSASNGGSAGRSVGNTIRNNGYGIAVLDCDQITFSGLHAIANNGPYGVFLTRTDRMAFTSSAAAGGGPPYYGTTIQDHDVWGVLAVSSVIDFLGSADVLVHSITGNGAAPEANDAGIWVGRQAEARLRNITISANFGPGIKGAAGAYVNLLNIAVLANSGDGLLLSDNSTGDLGSFSVGDGSPVPPNATFSGNAGKNIRCVNDSVLAGDPSGISKVQCGGGGGGGGGAKPSNALLDRFAGSGVDETRLEAHRQHLEELVQRMRGH